MLDTYQFFCNPKKSFHKWTETPMRKIGDFWLVDDIYTRTLHIWLIDLYNCHMIDASSVVDNIPENISSQIWTNHKFKKIKHHDNQMRKPPQHAKTIEIDSTLSGEGSLNLDNISFQVSVQVYTHLFVQYLYQGNLLIAKYKTDCFCEFVLSPFLNRDIGHPFNFIFPKMIDIPYLVFREIVQAQPPHELLHDVSRYSTKIKILRDWMEENKHPVTNLHKMINGIHPFARISA